MRSWESLIRASNRELEQVLRDGMRPDPGALVGREYDGYNRPWFTRLIGIQKFVKGFDRDEHGAAYGYNRSDRHPRSGPDRAWDPKPRRFGFYDLIPASEHPRCRRYTNAIVLDYGTGRNPWYDPSARIRDYLVCVEGHDLLLGKAYIDIGLIRLFSNFFVLRARSTGAEM
ncbi:MAG: hypothetical protein D6761_01315 [Candidatus Dadabacteria bacterium]|nr:MAG: hypothetical protein D6761_01315 [Candidatus Dadabacteria bacterium]